VRYFVDSIGEEKLEHAAKVLAGIPAGVQKAVGSAFKRAAAHGLTVGMKIVSEEYAIGQNELKSRTRNINTVIKNGASSIEVTFGYRGNVIPLLKFDTTYSKDGRVQTRVLRSSAKQALDNAFVAQVGSHRGVFERVGPKRFPVKELFGPSSVQAFYAHEETVDKMDEAISTEFDKRIDHEISRILNGWGV